MPEPFVPMRKGEKFPIGLRWHEPDLLAGQTILTCVCAVSPSGLTLDGAANIDNDVWETSQMLDSAAATVNVEYTVTFTITTSAGHTRKKDYLVRVRA